MFGAGAVALATVPFQLNNIQHYSSPAINNSVLTVIQNLHNNSCYLVVDGKENLLAGVDSNQFCKNIFLANYFSELGNKNDFYYLLNSKNLATSIFKDQLNKAKEIKVVYYSGGVSDDFVNYLKSKINTGKCEELAYWDNVLKCFSGSDLKKMVQYLTFLKFSATVPGVNIFQIAKDQNVYFIDSGCAQGAKYSNSTPAGEIQICRSMLDSFNKVHGAGLIYHEIIHSISWGHYYIRKDDGCIQNSDVTGKGGNADWDIERNKNKNSGYEISAYGAQLKYLNSLIKNSAVSCADRLGAYTDINFNLNLGVLCVKPNLSIIKPVCN